ncbi:hypothetical protein NB037_08320 [Rathayibacter sp. ZW T2_19]|uniref:Uncharacterized protein n=1 Tax=Rathayibacter rubneri TaxID=2950106 RepID=A0A9X2DWD9_9MICO|nr:hypothetical protein [Rathayibacter rubneri]MCM6762422.1 hypothetical protein [Rathayibacter rubneri]
MSRTPLGGDSGASSHAPEHFRALASAPPLDRRSLVTAAAWSAPVVAIALAAPAAAASEPAPAPPTSDSTLSFDTLSSWGTWGATGVTGAETIVQIQNCWAHGAGVGAPVHELSVVVRYPSTTTLESAPLAVSGAGWAFVARAADATGAVDLVFRWAGDSALEPGHSTAQLRYSVTAHFSAPTVLTGTASAPNADTVIRTGDGSLG